MRFKQFLESVDVVDHTDVVSASDLEFEVSLQAKLAAKKLKHAKKLTVQDLKIYIEFDTGDMGILHNNGSHPDRWWPEWFAQSKGTGYSPIGEFNLETSIEYLNDCVDKVKKNEDR